MENIVKKRLAAVEQVMSQHNPSDLKNIEETIESLKQSYPKDALEIESYFDDLCKKYEYDMADFSTAKIIETK